ncbi:MAG: hypothetical protein R3190_08590 [Thermoanaerobaculia bacterium]|nr:hypothetical protein [Thermoanaerobaculia bacterium]
MRALHLTLPLLLALLVPSGATAQQPADEISEEITVFESRLVLDLTQLSARQRGRLQPRDVLLLEGGLPREVTSLRRLIASGDFRIVLYFDVPLARSRTARLAGQHLGEYATYLTELGFVEVVVADPEPRTIYGPDRNDRLLAQRLAGLEIDEEQADLLRKGRREFRRLGETLPRRDPRRLEYLEREERLVRERADHLLRLASEGCGAAACVLVAVSDGFYESPRTYFLGRDNPMPAPGDGLDAARASTELATTLAAYEWVGLALPLREGELDITVDTPPATDFDRFIDATGGVKMEPKAGGNNFDLGLEAIEMEALPELQPLRRMALETAGSMARVTSQVEGLLHHVEQLWRAFYLTNRPFDGALRPIETRLRDGGPLTSVGWVRSSTPEATASLRVRDLLAGGSATGELAVEATASRAGADRVEVEIAADWGSVAELVSERRIRVSLGYTGADGRQTVVHDVARAPVLAEGASAWSRRLTADVPASVTRLVVVVEGLVPRRWGGTWIEL